MCTESAAKYIPNFSYGHPQIRTWFVWNCVGLGQLIVGFGRYFPSDFKILIFQKLITGALFVILEAEGGHLVKKDRFFFFLVSISIFSTFPLFDLNDLEKSSK